MCNPTSKPYFRTLPNPRAWQDGTTAGKGKVTDALGLMVAAVRVVKAVDLAVQPDPKQASRLDWKGRASTFTGIFKLYRLMANREKTLIKCMGKPY